MKRVLREAISKDGEKLTEISGHIQKPTEQQDGKEVQRIIKKWSNPPKKPMPEENQHRQKSEDQQDKDFKKARQAIKKQNESDTYGIS